MPACLSALGSVSVGRQCCYRYRRHKRIFLSFLAFTLSTILNTQQAVDILGGVYTPPLPTAPPRCLGSIRRRVADDKEIHETILIPLYRASDGTTNIWSQRKPFRQHAEISTRQNLTIITTVQKINIFRHTIDRGGLSSQEIPSYGTTPRNCLIGGRSTFIRKVKYSSW